MKISIKTDRETLLKILKDGDINKKLKIFSKLDDLSESDRIKILLKILEDNSWYLREQATLELAKFGNRVLPRLKKLCNKGFWYTRAAACRTLGEIGDLDGLATVITLLMNDTNPTVIKEAKEGIKKFAIKNGDDFFKKLQELKTELNLTENFYRVLIECLPEYRERIKEIFQTM
ncbi:MAG: HEAT repeat domain-containing protein [candidate division WOR-3 bacterium]|nr:HEAT repeat domain-containing protein [candidate division WOR-3 bacterium]